MGQRSRAYTRFIAILFGDIDKVAPREKERDDEIEGKWDKEEGGGERGRYNLFFIARSDATIPGNFHYNRLHNKAFSHPAVSAVSLPLPLPLPSFLCSPPSARRSHGFAILSS